MEALFNILIFPGFLFLVIFSFLAEFLDRKLHARLQNRVGPPWYQPVADFIKLLAKEDIVPEDANPTMFKLVPMFALTAVISSIFYIPLWGKDALFSFKGDVIVVLYLLTLPTLSFFIGGWYSTSLFARIGSVRTIIQLFAYEVPLFMSVLSAVLLANTWSLSETAKFYSEHHWYWVFNLISFFVALIALMGKLEKSPFDIPEAETEIVAGTFTEYSGRLLAFFRLTLNIEMIVGASLLAAVFLPFWLDVNPFLGFVIFAMKVLFIVGLISIARTIFARMRIDQMISFCWKFIVPLTLLQVVINLILKDILL